MCNHVTVPQRVLDQFPDNTDLLEWVEKNMPNGLYCTAICRRCEMYQVHKTGHTKDAIVYTNCNEEGHNRKYHDQTHW